MFDHVCNCKWNSAQLHFARHLEREGLDENYAYCVYQHQMFCDYVQLASELNKLFYEEIVYDGGTRR